MEYFKFKVLFIQKDFSDFNRRGQFCAPIGGWVYNTSMDIEELLAKLKSQDPKEKKEVVESLRSRIFGSNKELMELTKALILLLKNDSDELKDAVVETLVNWVEKGYYDELLKEPSIEMLGFYGQEELLHPAKEEVSQSYNEMEHDHLHDFAHIVESFHHDLGQEFNSDLGVKKESSEENGAYENFMKKREKYIDLWDFEIPEE